MGIPNIKVLPDSTGKAMTLSAMIELAYATGTIAFSKGDRIQGSVSGAKGIVLEITGTTASGVLDVKIDEDSSIAFTLGETLQVAGVTKAIANSVGTPFYTQKVELVSHTDPHKGLTINPDGTLPVKLIGLDDFQRLKVSQTTYIGEHMFRSDDSLEEWELLQVNGATIVHHPEYGGMLLTCPTTNGAHARMMTHLYHRYIPGQAHVIEMTIASGDLGKTNLIRRWGYADINDGVYYELDGTSLYSVLRHSVTGTVVEERTLQANWNLDKVDGARDTNNISGMAIDVSKDCIYGLSLQYLGAGTVRYSLYHDRDIVAVHDLHNDNRRNVSYMRSGSLPLLIEQVNTGTTASTSEMRVFCAVVKTEGKFEPKSFNFGLDMPVAAVSTEKVLFSLRPKQTFDSVDNRTWVLPKDIEIYASTLPVKIKIYKNATLTGATWAGTTEVNSAANLDIAATSRTGGKLLRSLVVSAGQPREIDLVLNGCNCVRLIRLADITQYQSLTIVAESLSGVSTDVYSAMHYEEVRC